MKQNSSSKSFFLLLAISFIVMFFSAFFLTRYSAIYKVSQEPTPTPKKSIGTVPVVQATPTAIPTPSQSPSPIPSPTPEIVTSLVPPVNGTITKAHSTEQLSYSKTTGDWSIHCGIDISGSDTEVKASARGSVSEITENGIMGSCIIIDHPGGLQTKYYGLKNIKVSENQNVVTGDILGTMGNAAPSEAAEGIHLHFEVWKDGMPLNPEDFLSENN